MDFGSIPFLARATPPSGVTTFIRFLTLTATAETGNGTTGWIYTGQSGSGPDYSAAAGSDWSLAPGVAGGWKVQQDYTLTPNGAPAFGVYTSATGGWSDNIFQIVYGPTGAGNWVFNGPGFSDLVDTPITRQSNDWVKWEFDATDGYTVSIARAATPETWTVLGSGTQTRSATIYPRLHSFTDAPDGAVYTAPQVLP